MRARTTRRTRVRAPTELSRDQLAMLAFVLVVGLVLHTDLLVNFKN